MDVKKILEGSRGGGGVGGRVRGVVIKVLSLYL